MRMIFFVILAMMSVSCATPPKFTYETENIIKVQITDQETGEVNDVSCKIESKDKAVDFFCNAYIEKDGNIYECKVFLNSKKRPVKEFLSFKESCTVQIK